MFIDVTRLGGSNVRLAPIAIAYLDDFRSGCHIHLVGGDYLRVEESRLEVELRARSCWSNAVPSAEPLIDPAREMIATDIMGAAGILSSEEAMGRRIEAATAKPRRTRGQ